MPIHPTEAYFRKIINDHSFIVSEVESVTSGGTFNVHLKNPAGSSIIFWVVSASVSSDGAYITRIYDSFSSAPSNGTDIEIESVLLDEDGEDNDGSATANKNVSFIADGTHAIVVKGGGSPGASLGGKSDHPIAAVGEGREIVIEVENTSSSTNNYAITIMYFES